MEEIAVAHLHKRAAIRLWIFTILAFAALLIAGAMLIEPIGTKRWLTAFYFLPNIFGFALFADIGISTYTALKYPSALDRHFLLRRALVGAAASSSFVMSAVLVSDYLPGDAIGDDEPWAFLILAPLFMGSVFSPLCSKMARVVFGAKYF